jgi:hypothetical protein
MYVPGSNPDPTTNSDLIDIQGQITSNLKGANAGISGLQQQIKQVTLTLEQELSTTLTTFQAVENAFQRTNMAYINSHIGGDPSALSTTPTTNAVITWNGSSWVDAISLLANDGDVSITSPTSGQVLTYNGTQWVNQTGGGGGGSVLSVFTRTGAVLAEAGDYSGYYDALGAAAAAAALLLPLTAGSGSSLTGDLYFGQTSVIEVPVTNNLTLKSGGSGAYLQLTPDDIDINPGGAGHVNVNGPAKLGAQLYDYNSSAGSDGQILTSINSGTGVAWVSTISANTTGTAAGLSGAPSFSATDIFVSGYLSVSGILYDETSSAGQPGQILGSTGSAIQWTSTFAGITAGTAEDGSNNLNVSSPTQQIVTTSGFIFNLPDATTLTPGQIYVFSWVGNTGGARDSQGNTVFTASVGDVWTVVLLSNGDAAGTWLVYQSGSNVTIVAN